jgi:hypothetical protein
VRLRKPRSFRVKREAQQTPKIDKKRRNYMDSKGLTKRELEELCKPHGDDPDVYFRPMLCRGDYDKWPEIRIMLAGINPATPITRGDINSEKSFVEKLTKYDNFRNLLKSKYPGDKVSRTRLGIDSFLEWLKNETDSPVAETDVCAYPTPKEEDLKTKSEGLKKRGKEVFYEVLTAYKPRLLIIYGNGAVKMLYQLLKDKSESGDGIKNIKEPCGINLNKPKIKAIEEKESFKTPMLTFFYSDSTTCAVFACRHFMYYGGSGTSYERFRKKIAEWLSKNDITVD